MKLPTERLVLRDLEEKDADALLKYAGDKEVSQWLSVVPHPYKKEDALDWIQYNKEEAKKVKREKYAFAITLDDELIGTISLDKVDRFEKKATVGYWLGTPFHRKGYMSEAFQEVIRFAFEELDLERLDICAYITNDASNALIKKMGFAYEGEAKKAARSKATGTFHDVYRYGLLKDTWKRQ